MRLQRGEGCPNKNSPVGLPKPIITAPCGSYELSWLVAETPLQGTRWRSRAATWVSLMTPQRNAAEV